MSETARQIPHTGDRIETGPVQFGDDWPGVFIRGDNAANYVFALGELLKREKANMEASPENFQHMLAVGTLADLLMLLASSDLSGVTNTLVESIVPK